MIRPKYTARPVDREETRAVIERALDHQALSTDIDRARDYLAQLYRIEDTLVVMRAAATGLVLVERSPEWWELPTKVEPS